MSALQTPISYDLRSGAFRASDVAIEIAALRACSLPFQQLLESIPSAMATTNMAMKMANRTDNQAGTFDIGSANGASGISPGAAGDLLRRLQRAEQQALVAQHEAVAVLQQHLERRLAAPAQQARLRQLPAAVLVDVGHPLDGGKQQLVALGGDAPKLRLVVG